MKKYFGTYILFSLVFFLMLAVLRGWFNLHYLPLWFGILVGVLLPDLDSFVHFFYLKPHELTSQRIKKNVTDRKFKEAVELFYVTKSERAELFFHSVLFQWIFIIFSYYVITSTNNPFGRGLVTAFLIHLVIDQYYDFKKNGNIQNWFHNFDFQLSHKQAGYYVCFMFATLLFLGLVV